MQVAPVEPDRSRLPGQLCDNVPVSGRWRTGANAPGGRRCSRGQSGHPLSGDAPRFGSLARTWDVARDVDMLSALCRNSSRNPECASCAG